MSIASIPVDLFNPGQVFACLGFMEVAEILFGHAEGGFDWSDSSNIRFELQADSDDNPFAGVLKFVCDATISSTSPREDIHERDGGETSFEHLGTHPCKIEDEKGKIRSALLPIRLSVDENHLQIDYWTDFDSGRNLFQLWTATNGNSAFVRFSKLHDAFKQAISETCTPEFHPFNLPAPVAANFRLELRRNWTAINLGFSPDKINKASGTVNIELMTYPVVELLAAIGLNHSRPIRLEKLKWSYAAWNSPLPTFFARAAISGNLMPDIARRFEMILEEPNDGGDKSISDAYEET